MRVYGGNINYDEGVGVRTSLFGSCYVDFIAACLCDYSYACSLSTLGCLGPCLRGAFVLAEAMKDAVVGERRKDSVLRTPQRKLREAQ